MGAPVNYPREPRISRDPDDYATGHRRRQAELDREHLLALHGGEIRAGEPTSNPAGRHPCPDCPLRYVTVDTLTQHWVRRHARDGLGSRVDALERPGAPRKARPGRRRRT